MECRTALLSCQGEFTLQDSRRFPGMFGPRERHIADHARFRFRIPGMQLSVPAHCFGKRLGIHPSKEAAGGGLRDTDAVMPS
jgi:hypothetical protein